MKGLNRLKWFAVCLVAVACDPGDKDINYTSIKGLWKCEETDEYSNVKIFNTDIDEVLNYENAFIISNFHNVGEDLFIRVTVSDYQLMIPSQSVNTLFVSGNGEIRIDFKTIVTEYTIETEGQQFTYIARFFR